MDGLYIWVYVAHHILSEIRHSWAYYMPNYDKYDI